MTVQKPDADSTDRVSVCVVGKRCCGTVPQRCFLVPSVRFRPRTRTRLRGERTCWSRPPVLAAGRGSPGCSSAPPALSKQQSFTIPLAQAKHNSPKNRNTLATPITGSIRTVVTFEVPFHLMFTRPLQPQRAISCFLKTPGELLLAAHYDGGTSAVALLRAV